MAIFSVYPVVGQTLHVLHRSELNEAGLAKLVKDGHRQRTIKQVHIIETGFPTVCDDAGEVWHVKPSKLGEWESVNPAAPLSLI